MTLSENPGRLKRFRHTSRKFQETFVTPHENLQVFVSEIISARHPFESGCLTLDQGVFEPRNLISLLNGYSIAPRYGRGWSISATGPQEMEAVLYSAFRDAVDFIFVPRPSPFALFADHDEYATFYAHSRSNLNQILENLAARGFQPVRNYEGPTPKGN